MTSQERFAAVVAEFAGQPGVSIPEASTRRFGSSALKVGGSIFAMFSGGRLVVKLPRDRVAALIADETGGPYDAGKGRPMAEWLTVLTDDDHTWQALAREAMEFVASRKG